MTTAPTEPVQVTQDPLNQPVLVTFTPQEAQASLAAPSVTPVSLVTALQEQLFLAGIPSDNSIQLGIVKGCPKWDELAAQLGSEPKLPYLYNAGRTADMGRLCLFGLETGEALEIELYRPDGSLADTAQIRVEALSDKIARLVQEQPPLVNEAGFAGFSGGKPLFSLDLWWPAGLPVGEWRLVARSSSGGLAEGAFEVDAYTPQPAIGLTKPHTGPYAAKANPFKRPALESGCQVVSSGQLIPIYVVNLPPGTRASLGVYQLVQVSANLIAELPFQANQKGNQQVDFSIPADWPAGRYYVLLPTSPEAVQLNRAGPLTCFEVAG